MKNTVKELLRQGKKTAGAWAQLGSSCTAEILSLAGFDWVLVDMEHAPGDLMTLVSQLQGIAAGKAVPVVRAPWNDFVIIKRILDAGAMGIIIPYVNDKAQAEAAVRACKYPPAGVRGIAGSPRAMGYGLNTKEYTTQANEEVLVITQIETAEAVKNLDSLLEVKGIDGFFIGPMDLATSMGYLGDPSRPEVQETIREVERKVVGSGKFLGTVTPSWEKAKELYDRGYQFLTLMADGMTVVRAASDMAGKFRGAFGENRS